MNNLDKISLFAAGKHPCWADYMPNPGTWVTHSTNLKKYLFSAIESFNDFKKRLDQEVDFNLPIQLLYFEEGEYILAQISASKDKVGRRFPLITGLQGVDLGKDTLEYYFDSLVNISNKLASITDSSEFTRCLDLGADKISAMTGSTAVESVALRESAYARLKSHDEGKFSQLILQLIDYKVSKFYRQGDHSPLCFESPINRQSAANACDWLKIFSQLFPQQPYFLLFQEKKITFIAESWLPEEAVLAFTGSFPAFPKQSLCSQSLINKVHECLLTGSNIESVLEREFSTKAPKKTTTVELKKSRFFVVLVSFAIVVIVLLVLVIAFAEETAY